MQNFFADKSLGFSVRLDHAVCVCVCVCVCVFVRTMECNYAVVEIMS